MRKFSFYLFLINTCEEFKSKSENHDTYINIFQEIKEKSKKKIEFKVKKSKNRSFIKSSHHY